MGLNEGAIKQRYKDLIVGNVGSKWTRNQVSKQVSKSTSKQVNKQASEQASKLTSKQINN
jgi:hypothetical protein